jgi:hypothetical protein
MATSRKNAKLLRVIGELLPGNRFYGHLMRTVTREQ